MLFKKTWFVLLAVVSLSSLSASAQQLSPYTELPIAAAFDLEAHQAPESRAQLNQVKQNINQTRVQLAMILRGEEIPMMYWLCSVASCFVLTGICLAFCIRLFSQAFLNKSQKYPKKSPKIRKYRFS